MPLCSAKTINKTLPISCLLCGSPCWDGNVTSHGHHWHSSSLCQCFWLHRADEKIWKLMVILPEKRQAGNCIHLLCFLASLLTCFRSDKGPFLALFLKMVSHPLIFPDLLSLLCFSTRCLWRDISLLYLSPHLWQGRLPKAWCHLRWRARHAGLGIWTHWHVSLPADHTRSSNL